MEKCSSDINSFPPQLQALKKEIDHFQDQIFVLQTSRQNDVWTLLERAVIFFYDYSSLRARYHFAFRLLCGSARL